MAVNVTRFSIDGQNLGQLRLFQMEHADALDGTDQIIVTCYNDLQKHDRLVWQDKQGLWHEHIVDEPKRTHDDVGRPTTTATCINSIAETWDDYIVDVRLSGGVQLALDRILLGTRWTAGTCTHAANASHVFYHISVREALQELVNVWGGELETTIVVDGNKVTQRIARIVSARGNLDSPKRFTWTKDILTIERTVGSENPKTRIYAYGRGEETDTGGFGRRIGIESVNDGVPYVEDTQATEIWGRPDGNGGKLPAIGKYENDQCEDPAQLLSEARQYLDQVKAPQVTYVANVIDLADYGRAWEEVSVGDHVAIIDAEFCDEGMYLHGRISKIERDLLEGTTVVTFGTLTDAIASPWRTMQAHLSALTSRATYWDVVSAADASWLGVLMSQLNAAYNTAGTYHYSSFEKGEIWSNVPLDDDGSAVSTSAESWAMNINGRGFRLASGFNADGTWNWRTFGDGKGFVASEMIAGIIRDAMGNNWWNLETGDFRLSGTATFGDRTVQQALGGIDATITDVDVEFAQSTSDTVAPTTGWSTTAPSYVSGKYIWTRTATTTANGTTYSTPAMISGRDGANGADGTGITSIVEQYYLSSSSTTQTGGSWSNNQPTWTSGKYIWTRSVITWDTTPATTTTTTPILAQALTQANSQAKSASDAVSAISTQSAIFNLLTNNGRLPGLFMSGGQLYINATYLHAGIISSLNGHSFWDLENNLFQMLGSNSAQMHIGIDDGSGNLKSGVTIEDGLRYKTQYGETFTVLPSGGHKRGQAQSGGAYIDYTNTELKVTNSYGNAGVTITTGGTLMSPTADIRGDGPLRINSSDEQVTFGANRGSAYSNTGYITFNAKTISLNAGDTNAGGRFTASAKNRLLETRHYGNRLLYCYETPAAMFGDVGSAKTDEHGECVIAIDDIFTETMRTDYEYQVFLQPCGSGNLYVAEKHPTHFIVRGTPSLPFDWELKGRQIDFETERLEEYDVLRAVEAERTDEIAAGVLSAYDSLDEYVRAVEDMVLEPETEEGIDDEAAI